MLQNTSKGKDLTEKQLIMLGGSPDQQREFLEQLNPEQDGKRSRFSQTRKPRSIPVSNKYALGYTYHDVLDADQEDVLARINVYMLSNPSGAFAPLLKPLLTSKTVKDTLITILLDWSEPWKWARQLRQWIRLLRKVILSLDDETKIEMEETMNAWKEKRVGLDTQNQSAEQKSGTVPPPPPGPGEWDEGLGIPLSVVCIQAENIEKLEREQGWQEDHFDFLLQWIRTVLLKHGASLCYVASFDDNQVRTLLHSSLSIQSLLKRSVIKHNVIDRDKILVPPNWDSWGKIRILRDAFEVESVAERWSLDIQSQADQFLDYKKAEVDPNSAVALFEASIPKEPEQPGMQTSTAQITVTVPTLQDFLVEQKSILDKLAIEDEREGYKGGNRAINTASRNEMDEAPTRNRGSDHTSSYQINVNGIDVDAEEATRRLREREQERNATGKRDGTPKGIKIGADKGTNAADGVSTEHMKTFFADLMSKKTGSARSSGAVSGVASPRRESPAPERRTTDT